LEHFTSAIRFTPCYAQEKLKINAEMRVVMFGSEPHAFRLTPKRSADDLKQLELEEILHEPCRIDLETLRKIRALMAHFNLQFSAIDFAIVDDGEPVFLELNPNGQWLWLQYMTGVNLSEPFADFLCK
jgi:glutathione synthase/RimK-type ligase-like ATP-grasp enzyme